MLRIHFALKKSEIKAALPKGNAALLSEYQKGLRPISEALAVSVHLAEVRVLDLQVSVHPALGRLAWVLVCRASVLVRALVCRASVLVRALVCRVWVLVRALVCRVWVLVRALVCRVSVLVQVLVCRASVLVRVLVCRVSVPVWGRGDVSDQRGHCLPGGFRPWLRRLRKAQ